MAGHRETDGRLTSLRKKRWRDREEHAWLRRTVLDGWVGRSVVHHACIIRPIGAACIQGVCNWTLFSLSYV